jgi:hypothetical protein
MYKDGFIRHICKLSVNVKKASRTNGTFGFTRHTSPTLRKCQTFTNSNKYNNVMSKIKRATFCLRTNNDNASLKLNLADYKNFKY